MDLFIDENEIDNQIKQLILRPSRFTYSQSDLGPQQRLYGDILMKRCDFQVQNARSEYLQCSLYLPKLDSKTSVNRPPLVVFLHGNTGSRLQALKLLPYVAKQGMALLSFDFAGCGNSEGKFITLGVHQHEDLAYILEYVEENYKFGKICVWGFSMGAATALMYCSNYPDHNVSCLVLDSAFSSMEILAEDMADDKLGFASFFAGGLIKTLKQRIIALSGCDIMGNDIATHSANCDIPALFTYSKDDKVIQYTHSERLLKKYGCQIKQNFIFTGNHNTIRGDTYYTKVLNFIGRHIQKPKQKVIQSQSLYDDHKFLSPTKNVPNLSHRDYEPLSRTQNPLSQSYNYSLNQMPQQQQQQNFNTQKATHSNPPQPQYPNYQQQNHPPYNPYSNVSAPQNQYNNNYFNNYNHQNFNQQNLFSQTMGRPSLPSFNFTSPNNFYRPY